MLDAEPTFERLALNRVTFGARDTDVQFLQISGWPAWVETQLAAPTGDDAALTAHLAAQTMPIKYAAKENSFGGWEAVNENRPLNYLNAGTETLWPLAVEGNKTIAPAETLRAQQEVAAATWIRNTHAEYQLREFMVDFWHNHFNVGRQESDLTSVSLPVYDRAVIRSHALGNFRELLEAVASSTSMLLFLDNAESNARHPNENYARELLELHTLGAGAYLGVTMPAGLDDAGTGVDAPGFTDQDIIEASRALSGWTVEFGQRSGKTSLPSTGKFVYNPTQHNNEAAVFMGVNLAPLTADMAQGRMVLDIAAAHPATAQFVCTKLARRMFGDNPPAAAVARSIAAFTAHQGAPNQIAKVLEAMLLDGPEIGQGPAVKLRRPYERMIAAFRTTDMVVNAYAQMLTGLAPLNDGLFIWPEPDGRPDNNAFWLTSVATLGVWNNLLSLQYLKVFGSNMFDQTPSASLNSATGIADYWIGRMVGYQIGPDAYAALLQYVAGAGGLLAVQNTGNLLLIEGAYRKLAALIACTEEFSYR